MSSGLPQGSVLGQLHFVLYVNDMQNCYDKVSFTFSLMTQICYTPTEI